MIDDRSSDRRNRTPLPAEPTPLDTDPPPAGLTKDEFFSVARQLKPDLTRAEYESMWRRYLIAKAAHDRRLKLH